ncbi:MAG: class I tRNA ligase family protein [Candidatus Thermoplasmatota archaeon]|nr:class I tRNA ligase family protein [Candidatus Thermoplasmatota archaeon]
MGETQQLKPLELEDRTYERWNSRDINDKLKESRKGGRNYYAVFPPLSIKDNFDWDILYKIILYDVWTRFKSMRGFNVRHGLGYDAYNLRVEKSAREEHDSPIPAGMPEDKWKDIFDDMDEKADELKEEMRDQNEALGLWKDSEYEYDTRGGSFVDSLWWSVKELMEKDLLIKDEKPVTWCPECKSPVTNPETVHREHQREKTLLRVPTSGGKERYFLVEVKDPWMLPVSMSIAVRPDEKYSVVRITSKEDKTMQIVILAEKVDEMVERGEVKEYEIINEVKGKKLEGLSFKYPLHEKVPYHTQLDGEHIHKIICSKDIEKEGTGLVLLTPPHKEEHWNIAKKKGLEIFNPIEKNGHYDSGVRDNKYSGLDALQSDEIILDDLESKDLLFSREKEDRKIKFCSACMNKVIKIPHWEWFFSISEMDDKDQDYIEKIDLIPSGQEIEFRDWIVTKDTRWGISFPLWKCSCGNSFIPDSRSELSENSDFEEDLVTPDIISQVEVTCPECGEEMNWEEKILNPIFVQASSPWAQLAYPHEKMGYQSWWPGNIFISKNAKRDDLLSATITLTSSLLGDESIEEMLVQGPVVSEIDYKDVKGLASKQGYDSLRLYLLDNDPPWETRKIEGDDLQDNHPLVRVLWNLSGFLEEQIEESDTDPKDKTLEFLRENMEPADEWLLSRVEDTKRKVGESYEEARYEEVIDELKRLVMEDLAQWYFSQTKARLKEENDESVRSSILKVIYESLISVSKMLDPISPFIADEVFYRLSDGDESVFMEEWPESNELLRNEDLEEEMEEVKTVVDKIMEIKHQNDIPKKWPLKQIVYDCQNQDAVDLMERFGQFIKEKAKVKEIEIIGPDEEWEDRILEVTPRRETIGQAYHQWESRIATMLKQQSPEEIKAGIEEGEYTIGLQGQIIEIRPEMVTFEASLPEGFEEINLDDRSIYIDLEIYDEVWEEVMSRETMLRLKSMRLDFDLEEEDEIKAYIETDEDIAGGLAEHREMLMDQANVRELSINEESTEDIEYVYEWDINGETVEIGVIPLYKTKVIDYYKRLSGVDAEIAEDLYEAGFTSVEQLQEASAQQVSDIDGIKRSLARGILQSIGETEEEEVIEEAEKEVPEEVKEKREPSEEPREEKAEEEIDQEEAEERVEEEKEPEEEAPGEEMEELPGGVERSSTYLISEKESDKSGSFELFKNILKSEKEGLCVTRDYPDKIKDKYGLENVKMIWLSNVDREDVIRPKSLEKFSLTIENFLTRSGGVILLNGLEYLVTNNDFRTVLHLIQSIKDQVAINEAILMIPINPDALEENQIDLLSGEVDEFIEP